MLAINTDSIFRNILSRRASAPTPPLQMIPSTIHYSTSRAALRAEIRAIIVHLPDTIFIQFAGKCKWTAYTLYLEHRASNRQQKSDAHCR